MSDPKQHIRESYPNPSEATMSRRDLLKGGALIAAGTAVATLAGCQSAQAETTNNPAAAAAGVAGVTWEESTEGPKLNVEITETTVSMSDPMVFKQCMTGLHESLICQVITPTIPGAEKDAKYPCVVYVASGGFSKSDPFTSDLNMRVAIARKGFVVATICHRIGIADGKWPAPLEDLKQGIRWLRTHADDLKIQKDYIGAIGASAGGYFATMLGVTGGIESYETGEYLNESSSVQAVVDLYGPSDLTIIGSGLDDAFPDERNAEGKGYESNHFSPATPEALMVNGSAMVLNPGGSVQDTPETAAAASPFTYIGREDPPFLILHGDKDTSVSPVASMALFNRLKDAGVEATRYVIEGAGHGGPKFNQPQVLDLITDFFAAHLKTE